MKRPQSALLVIFFFGLITLGACLDPTEITVWIATDAQCADSPVMADHFSGVAIAVGAQTTVTSPSAVAVTCRPIGDNTQAQKLGLTQNDIGTLVLVPGDKGAGEVDVVIVAGVTSVSGSSMTESECLQGLQAGTLKKGDPCIVARRRLGFVTHTKLDLPVELEATCLGIFCDESSTCHDGSCVSSTVKCDQKMPVCPFPGGQGGGGGQGGEGAGATTSTSSLSTSTSGITSASTSSSMSGTSSSMSVGTSGTTTTASGTSSTTSDVGTSTSTGGCMLNDGTCTGGTPSCVGGIWTCDCPNMVPPACTFNALPMNCTCQ